MRKTLKALARSLIPARLQGPLSWVLHPGRFELFHGPVTYNMDGLASRFNADFMKDPRFAAAHAAGQSAQPPGRENKMFWITHVVLWAADIGARLDGDFVECGVHYGFTARAVIDYTRFAGLPKTFYLLDTFRGPDAAQMSEAEKADGTGALLTAFGDFHAVAEANFRPFPNVRLVQGLVPDTLPEVGAERIAFLHLAMGITAPTIAAAEYFWPRLASGAVMVLNDYGSPVYHTQKLAFDRFAAERKVPLLSLPTGQALIVKP